MQQINAFFITLHQYIGGNNWFTFLLLGTGLFFTFYLKFPQIRYFKHAIRIVKGIYDKKAIREILPTFRHWLRPCREQWEREILPGWRWRST